MDYSDAVAILNQYIFEEDRRNLIRKIAERPERFVGLFRPTKPRAKLLQNLLQSHEIRFGDALESLIRQMLANIGFENLPQRLETGEASILSLDQYFTDGKTFYFLEQKVRDDHDSAKKRGQIENFERKLALLHDLHGENLEGIMYFVDPDLTKNRNYYAQEIERLKELYGTDLFLFYGRDLFSYLGREDLWESLLSWLRQWKDSLPDFPEIDMDRSPYESFEELKSAELRYWRKILANEKVWNEGIIQVLFSKGTTLELLQTYFEQQGHADLARTMRERLRKYYE